MRGRPLNCHANAMNNTLDVWHLCFKEAGTYMHCSDNDSSMSSSFMDPPNKGPASSRLLHWHVRYRSIPPHHSLYNTIHVRFACYVLHIAHSHLSGFPPVNRSLLPAAQASSGMQLQCVICTSSQSPTTHARQSIRSQGQLSALLTRAARLVTDGIRH